LWFHLPFRLYKLKTLSMCGLTWITLLGILLYCTSKTIGHLGLTQTSDTMVKCLRTLRREYNTEFDHNKVKRSQELLQSMPKVYESKLASEFASNNNSNIYKCIRSLTKTRYLQSTLYHNLLWQVTKILVIFN